MSTEEQKQGRRVLIVDDEETVRKLYPLQLGGEFVIETAASGEDGLAVVAEKGPFSVVVADMHMPGMSGSEFLHRIQERYPDTTRIMLTADGNQEVAVQAVNTGQVFRFLKKPVPVDVLASAIRAGLEHHRMRTAEKELLASTLNGSINLLVQMLSLCSPLAFGRATRIKRTVEKLCERLQVPEAWEIGIAAQLSQLGCVTVPDNVLRKVQSGMKLSPQEEILYRSHPQMAHDLVSAIPRLSRIADIIARQQQPWDPDAGGDARARDIRRRAAFVKVALDYDALVARGRSPREAQHELSRHAADYHPEVLGALAEVVNTELDQRSRAVSLSDLEEGMVLEDDVIDGRGIVLITRGHELANWHIERLRIQHETGRTIAQPIRVLPRNGDAHHDPDRMEIPATSLFCDDVPDEAAQFADTVIIGSERESATVPENS